MEGFSTVKSFLLLSALLFWVCVNCQTEHDGQPKKPFLSAQQAREFLKAHAAIRGVYPSQRALWSGKRDLDGWEEMFRRDLKPAQPHLAARKPSPLQHIQQLETLDKLLRNAQVTEEELQTLIRLAAILNEPYPDDDVSE